MGIGVGVGVGIVGTVRAVGGIAMGIGRRVVEATAGRSATTEGTVGPVAIAVAERAGWRWRAVARRCLGCMRWWVRCVVGGGRTRRCTWQKGGGGEARWSVRLRMQACVWCACLRGGGAGRAEGWRLQRRRCLCATLALRGARVPRLLLR